MGVHKRVVKRLVEKYNSGFTNLEHIDPEKATSEPTSIEELEDFVESMMEKDNVRRVSLSFSSKHFEFLQSL